jgi:hypothetical protein
MGGMDELSVNHDKGGIHYAHNVLLSLGELPMAGTPRQTIEGAAAFITSRHRVDRVTFRLVSLVRDFHPLVDGYARHTTLLLSISSEAVRGFTGICSRRWFGLSLITCGNTIDEIRKGLVDQFGDGFQRSPVHVYNKWSECSTVKTVVFPHPDCVSMYIVEHRFMPDRPPERVASLYPFNLFTSEISTHVAWELEHAGDSAGPPAAFRLLRCGIQDWHCLADLRDCDSVAWNRKDACHDVRPHHPPLDEA